MVALLHSLSLRHWIEVHLDEYLAEVVENPKSFLWLKLKAINFEREMRISFSARVLRTTVMQQGEQTANTPFVVDEGSFEGNNLVQWTVRL